MGGGSLPTDITLKRAYRNPTVKGRQNFLTVPEKKMQRSYHQN
jgi:hypothetical protein